MSEEEIIHIKGIRIKARKRICTVVDSNNKFRWSKEIYTIPLDLILYEKIPKIIEINNKKFYKTNINKANQKEFKLIEC